MFEKTGCVTVRQKERWVRFSCQSFVFFNAYLTRLKFTNGQVVWYKSFVPRIRQYADDFFRNLLWRKIDEPIPMDTLLRYLRRYGMIPRKVLVRIYFFDAKKKRRWYFDVARSMDRYISQINFVPRRLNYVDEMTKLFQKPEYNFW
jgi:hypothetical protein